MGRTGKGIAVAAAVTAGAAVTTRVVVGRRAAARQQAGRPHAITVNRLSAEVAAPAALPEPLAELRDKVDIAFADAPGDRGTEITVRPRPGVSVGDDEIRGALRRSRSLLEVGDVLLPDAPATTRPTLLNRPLRAVTRRGREEGLL